MLNAVTCKERGAIGNDADVVRCGRRAGLVQYVFYCVANVGFAVIVNPGIEYNS